MSRLKENYENSRYRRFKRWYDGEVNLLDGIMDAKVPESDSRTGVRAYESGMAEARMGTESAANPAKTTRTSENGLSGDSRKADFEERRRASEDVYGPDVWPQQTVMDYAEWRRYAQQALEARIRHSVIEDEWGYAGDSQTGTVPAGRSGTANVRTEAEAKGQPGTAAAWTGTEAAGLTEAGDTLTGASLNGKSGSVRQTGADSVQPDTSLPDRSEAVSAQPNTFSPGRSGATSVRPDAVPSGVDVFQKFYAVMAVVLCFGIIAVFLWTTVHLPPFGSANNPANNEVPARYIEKGVAETGAVNFVTGMILDYRAFDTFGESCVLFIASCCVLVLLRIDASDGSSRARSRGPQEDDRLFEPKNDVILQRAAFFLVPLILVFGVYIVLNGHLSPGGGFSGGAVLGSGLILYLNAFGFAKTERFFTEKVYRRVTLCALTFYCFAKSYSFFTGANHLESGIPLGKPGAILSSGLILPLNICVGLVVMCTMYAFYTLFRKGGM